MLACTQEKETRHPYKPKRQSIFIYLLDKKAILATTLSRLRDFLSSFNPLRGAATFLPLSINNFV